MPTSHVLRRRLVLAGAALALLVLSACGVGGNAPNPFDQRGNQSGRIRIVVDNQNFNDVRVYAVTTGGRRTLGQVGGRSNATFQMDWRQLDEIRFRLEFLAGDNYETPRLNVSPGDAVDVYIPQNPNNTVVRRR